MPSKLNLTAKPNTSIANKTGAWKTHRPVTDNQKCTSCSLCAKICPEGCIEMVKKPEYNQPKPVTDYDYCKGCALCAHECPVNAIKMEYEK